MTVVIAMMALTVGPALAQYPPPPPPPPVDVGADDSGRDDGAVADRDDAAGAPVTGRRGALPFTGAEVGILLVVGIVLLGGGLVALRRREDAKVSVRA
jgi:LPXTG-motif cell wall-anchored protein